MRIFLAAFAMFCAGPAFATGGFDCDADDAKASIWLNALTTRGMGFPVLRFDGTVELKDASVAADLRSVKFDGSHLPQYWAEDGELRLFVYRERTGDAPYGHIQLIVRAKFDENDDLAGRYDLEVVDMTGVTDGEAKTVRIEGDISCVLG